MDPKRETVNHPAPEKPWIDAEAEGCHFHDTRLDKRFRILLEQLWKGIGRPLPLACQDWASTKAAYRFFSNERVSEAQILAGHFDSTRERFEAVPGQVLVLHDTCEFSFKREDEAAVGFLGNFSVGKTKDGRTRLRTGCGLLMHSSLVVTTEGLPLGLAAIKFWTRKKFKGCNALKKKVNPTRIPIEEKESYRWLENLRQSTALLGAPERCVHVGDRESDIYELFCEAHEAGTQFLIRTCVDRLAEDDEHTIADKMREVSAQGIHRLELKNDKGEPSEALLEIKYLRLKVLPPIGKRKRYPDLALTVIHAQEQEAPKGRERIQWKLITNLPVESLAAAVEKLQWYAMRWKIETFHKILKSGCKTEDSKLRTAERLTNLIAVFCVVSWRVFWMTMLNRATPDAPPEVALTQSEIVILDELIKLKPWDAPPKGTLSEYLKKIAKLGGYLARASDPPPGNMIMWRGVSRLIDIQLGYNMAAKLVGN
jgi:hypothetical protein